MVYSASAIMAADRFHDPLHFLKRQGLWVLLGMGALWAGMRFDYRRPGRLVVPLMAASFVLLVLLLVPRFVQDITVTPPCVRLVLASVQLGELGKLSLLLYLASFLARREEVMASFSRGLLPLLLVAGGMAGLTLLQPDMGNAMVLIILTLALAYLGGARVAHMGLI